MPCDLCSHPEIKTVVSSHAMRHAAQKGFNPVTAGLVPEKLARLTPLDFTTEWKQQALNGLLSHANWRLCATCVPKVMPFLS